MGNRILIHGLQNSGASFVSFVIAQKAGCLAVLDLGVGLKAPRLTFVRNKDIVLKCVTNEKIKLSSQVKRFKAKKVALVLRNPFVNFYKLNQKPYKDIAGTIEQKFQKIDSIYSKGVFDSLLIYEECVQKSQNFLDAASHLNFGIDDSFFELKRTADDILKSNREASSWFRRPGKWGFGNIHFSTKDKKFSYNDVEAKVGINKKLLGLDLEIDEQIKKRVRSLAPNICNLYENKLNY